MNSIEIKNNIVKMGLCDRNDNLTEFVYLDKEDLKKVKFIKWHLHSTGYARNRNIGYMHNIILNRDTSNRKINVDHINRNKLDNRKCNLRIVEATQNQYNKGLQSNNTSGYPGVGFKKREQKWRARIQYKGKEKYIGLFNTKEDAIKARKQAELKYVA